MGTEPDLTFVIFMPFTEVSETVTFDDLASLRDAQPSLTPLGTYFLFDAFAIYKITNSSLHKKYRR